MADDYSGLIEEDKSTKSAGGLKGGMQAAERGFAESVPFTGEALAEGLGLPEPGTFPERLTRRAARNLPYALAAGPFTGGIPAALGYLGSVALGQTAEELGVPEKWQPVAEILGGGAGQVAAGTAGRVIGFVEPKLNDLYKQAKNTFKLGPGAKTAEGMKYGAGDTAVEASQNLTRATELATERTGFPTKSVDGTWIKNTGKSLGGQVEQLFGGKQFQSDQQFLNEVGGLVQDANTAFGEKGNVVKAILDKNIQGQRTGGSLTDPVFNAMGLRGAIEEVNQYLATAEGPQAKILHKTAEALHNLAERNLQTISPNLVKEYQDWRKAYTSFATIRDVYEKISGRTAAGQIPLDELHQAIIKRGNETTHPLFSKLAEWGPLFRGAKQTGRPNVATALYRTITEAPASKAIQSIIQPSVPKQFTGFPGKYLQKVAPYAQTAAPSAAYTQTGKNKAADPYSGLASE
jgi:hypothetical protein